MNFSPLAKLGIVVALVFGLLAFLVIVDLGVNAGRIHYGVSASGIDIGGLTRAEAVKALRTRSQEVDEMVIHLTAEGLNVGITPRCLGWSPRIHITVGVAYDIGRENVPFGALADRASAWLWGHKVGVRGRLARGLMRTSIDAWDEQLTALGAPIHRRRLRDLLERAISTADPGPYEFPTKATERSSLRGRAPLLPVRAMAPLPRGEESLRAAVRTPRLRGQVREPGRGQADPPGRRKLPPGCRDYGADPLAT